jgi:hypothetical protein
MGKMEEKGDACQKRSLEGLINVTVVVGDCIGAGSWKSVEILSIKRCY